MNTIPSTFNGHQIDRTVLGGMQPSPDSKLPVSVIMLNYGGSHLRVQTIENLLGCGFRSVVWIEPTPDSFNIEDISRRYPSIKFVIPLEKATDGELINACVSEIDSEYFLVLRDTLRIPQGILLQNLAENLTKDKKYCIVPRLINADGQGISVTVLPEAKKGRFLLTPSQCVSDGLPTLYPPDFIGLYNREKFIQLGGYDYTITAPYWQNADLSLRAWLWGEKIALSTSFLISYEQEKTVEDTTRNYSYIRFYLKNILPSFKDDHGVIKPMTFFNFKVHSSCGFFESLSLFKSAQKWVEMNKYRFKMDVQQLIENWVSGK